jgi:hypothetical protein
VGAHCALMSWWTSLPSLIYLAFSPPTVPLSYSSTRLGCCLIAYPVAANSVSAGSEKSFVHKAWIG